MKKWLVTFCALGLIATQAATADASTNKEEVKDPSIQRIVKMVKEDHAENVFADLVNDLMGNSKGSLKEFSTNLLVKKLNLEELLKATANKELANKSTKETSVAPTNNVTKQQNKNETKEVVKEPVSTSAPEKQESTQSSNQVPKSNVETTTPSTSTTSQPVESKKTTQASQTTPAKAATTSVSEFEAQVVELTNAERAKYGLAPLKSYQPLMTTAHAKSADMAKNNYFSHTSPTYGSPFDQMKAAGISYRAAGENIAQGQRTPEEVVQAWMNSEGHRANILNANFTHIGVGYVSNGNYWTQQFAQM